MKMKKLLAAALAATMMLSSMVTSFVASAETTANAVDVTIAEIAVGAETYTANFDITFDPAVEGPHLLFDVDATGTLTNIASKTDGINVYGDEGGTNLAEGLFITEATSKEFSAISLTATFALDAAAVDGTVIEVKVAVTDNADWDENTIEIAAGSATYTVVAPVEECDHANATLEYAVVEGNCVTTKVCPDCDAEPEVIATIANTVTDVKQSIVLAEGLAINFRTVASAVSEYSDIYGEFKKDLYDANTITGTDDSVVVAKEETVSKVLYQTCKYEGIASYEMTSNIHLSLYGTDAAGNVVLLRDLDYKFVDYLDAQYGKLTGIYRNVLGRLADYGTYIQLMNSYHIDHVPNASMPSDLKIDLPTTFNNTNVTETGIKIYTTPKVGNTLTVNYRILKTDVSNYDDFSLTISYVDAFNVSKTLTVSLSAGDFSTYKSGTKEYWNYEFKGLVAAKINEINVAELKDTTGNQIGYVSSGLPSYLKKNYDSYNTSTNIYFNNFAKVCQAITAYGDAVAALYN